MDHYSTLGVNKDASQDDIKRAFRKLASQHHPDKGGDTKKFQEVQAAYDILGDPEKRRQYDNPAPNWAGGGQPGGFHFDFGPQFNTDFFSQMFGQGFGHPQQSRRSHMRLTVWITFRESVLGGAKHLALQSQAGSNTVQIEIPKGISDGDAVQYSGVAPGGIDLVVQFKVHPDYEFKRNGLDLVKDHAVPLWDLLLGGDIEIDTINGSRFSMRVPAGTQPGTQMRVKGQGVKTKDGQTGDLYIKISIEMPKQIAPEIIDAIQKYRK